MAEKGGESSDEEPTIAEDVVVTKYKMAGDMANSKRVRDSCFGKPLLMSFFVVAWAGFTFHLVRTLILFKAHHTCCMHAMMLCRSAQGGG